MADLWNDEDWDDIKRSRDMAVSGCCICFASVNTDLPVFPSSNTHDTDSNTSQMADESADEQVEQTSSEQVEQTSSEQVEQTSSEQVEQKSKLLSLSDEILCRIMSYVLGGPVLHIDHAERVQAEHGPCQHGGLCQLGQGPEFYIHPCRATMSESEAYTEFCDLPSSLSTDEHDLEVYYVPDAQLRHSNCQPWDHAAWTFETQDFDCSDRAILEPDQHPMTAFKICRALYKIAFEHFWTKTTFSFGDSTHFEKFISRLVPKQRQLIRSLNITLPFFGLTTPFEIDERRRERALFDLDALVDMDRLENVNLALHGSWFADKSGPFKFYQRNRWIGDVDIRKTAAAEILQLEVVDIKKVNVIVFDNERETEPTTVPNQFEHRYTLREKKELAKFVRNILHSSKADRQILRERQRRILEAENLVRGLKFSQQVDWQVQRKSFLTSMYGSPHGEVSCKYRKG
ncbi:MAG: hypothetical protein LQ352_007968 [Teloschistes flavicans]|nr:MAG: hypothetical protein LQ352_007968 [Teloschistes flavicans]